MKTIRDLLERDLRQKIEEIIKLDQTDEESVYKEITEYIATERICNQYRELLKAIAEAPAEPHEGVGVWISGFFGSGKSYFAKILGYLLQNNNLPENIKARQRFAERLATSPNRDFLLGKLESLNKFPTHVLLFEIISEIV
ncbi:MAG: hypothetical protein STSR0007_14930 [Thermovirga sp.]